MVRGSHSLPSDDATGLVGAPARPAAFFSQCQNAPLDHILLFYLVLFLLGGIKRLHRRSREGRHNVLQQ